MLHRCMVVLASICLFVQLLIPTGNLAHASTPRNPSAPSTQLLTGYFTENKGQWDDSIRFVSRNDQQIIAVTLEGVWTFNPNEAASSLPLGSMLSKGLPTLPKALPMEAEFNPKAYSLTFIITSLATMPAAGLLIAAIILHSASRIQVKRPTLCSLSRARS